MFNTWMNDPEAFQSDYEEYQALIRKLAQEKADHEAELASEGMREVHFDDDCDEQPEGDLFDIVRQHDEDGEPTLEADDLQEWRDPAEDNLSDVEADADTLASAGMGTDEDYGDYGQCEWEE